MTDLESLWRGFCAPPDDARPRAWWHWMDGNVDPEGIRLDLEWLHRVGVRGVQHFDGGMGTPLVVPERVRHGSPQWRAAVALAVSTARGLGLEFTVATSAGWSAAGAPWVDAADAMKKVVWSETVIQGGRAIDVALPPLPDVAGPYQDCPRCGADPTANRYAEDWLVIAVPADDTQTVLLPTSVTASSVVGDVGCLTDGRFADAVSLPRDPDGSSSAWIEQVFDEPTSVGAMTIGLPGPRGFGAAPAPGAVLEASADGIDYAAVAHVPAGKSTVRTVAFAPVSARRFRLGLSAGSAADALPHLADGVRLPPVLRRASEFLVTEFALWRGGRVHEAELKAGFGAALDYYALDTPRAAGTAAIRPERVLDLTARVDGHGQLTWQAPPGAWRILRFGGSPTGQTNGPAPPDATGLEVDKLDAATVRGYLTRHLALFGAAEPGRLPDPIQGLLSDSIESGPQNFTPRLRERFAAHRGYDLLPWLPALAGYVVGDGARTDRFLWDYRRTIADLLASDYYGTLAHEAHVRGLTYYAEALEDHRPQLGDDLAMRSHADVPMGAMWMFDPGAGHPAPTYIADVKGASSVAHVYGKTHTGAESMSAFHRPWSYTPRRLKHVADLELALGVTRFCIHTSPHQPVQAPPPGIGLSPYLGQTFIRSEPWAEMARPWIDYLARCSYLLNQGVPAVDVAVFIGEEGPLTALYGDELDRSVPAGIDFDYVNLDALEDRFRAEDGVLCAGESRYRVLFLGGSSARMTVRALRRVLALVTAGATVVGRRPLSSPSLADDDADHERLCEQLWSGDPGGPRGAVLDTDDLACALADLGVVPSLAVDGPELLRVGRRLGDTEVVFLANPLPTEATATITVRNPSPASYVVAWDPVTVRRSALPDVVGDPSHELDARRYRLTLPPLGSVFLVEGGAAEPPEQPEAEVALGGEWQLRLPGVGEFALRDGPRPWTDLGENGTDARGFAGVGTYATELAMDDAFVGLALQSSRRVILECPDVADIARIRVNGVDCGVVWTHPFSVDVTSALHQGRNVVEVDVAAAWMNRLIAEAAAPTGEIFGPVAGVYSADAPIRAAGLRGPVTLRVLS